MNFIHNIFGLYILLDIYTYFGLKSLVPRKFLRWYQVFYWATSLYVYYSFYRVYQMLDGGAIFRDTSANIYLGLFLTFFIGKLFFSGLVLVQDLGRIIGAVILFIKKQIAGQSTITQGSPLPGRRRFLTLGAAGLAAVPFFTMLYGITKGKYNYTINRLKLRFADLPPAFEGFKIVQISDIHAGSFDNPREVAKGVKLINEQQPDLILFTGDLVNSDKDEIDPYIGIFKELSAGYGKFCTLGNHDYYGVPRDETAEQVYWADFNSKFGQMGFSLLNNQNQVIEKDGQRIQLLGVENWGASRYFPKRGDLNKALKDTKANDFCILMSHDPTHWDEKVLPHHRHIPLTLSGHTHGFQFGINVPGFKWSPAQYRYPRWMGLYEENGQKLYVNRGFGFLGFPGRVGMWPEITVIELGVG